MGDPPCVQAQPDQDGTRIIVCSGEFDIHSQGTLDQALQDAHRDGATRTVLGMEQVSFADSSVINTLLVAHRRQHLVLAGPLSPQIARLFEMTGIDAVLNITADLTSAFAR
ncbi:STAS domain-containing protein [Streptomyces goshikiensis]|uniref:STAS domain-containing protein n=1 Tax=Streptomyces goshikiensis TaxID=1942 RepID=UPI003411173C|nr:STAS domain-containing protein [Streptomyces goshikiensis]